MVQREEGSSCCWRGWKDRYVGTFEPHPCVAEQVSYAVSNSFYSQGNGHIHLADEHSVADHDASRRSHARLN